MNAENIVEKLISDLKDRRGFRQEWEEIDEDIQQEIRETWKGIIEGETESKGEINVAENFLNNRAYWMDEYECLNEEEFKDRHDLMGKVVLYPLGDDTDDNCFYCGPLCGSEEQPFSLYLSDSIDINRSLRELVKDTPYAKAFDFGAAENFHMIFEEELPEGKSVEDAYEFLKSELLRFSNVVLDNEILNNE
jgi:hypothetical protein